jgi:hypothetical protein
MGFPQPKLSKFVLGLIARLTHSRVFSNMFLQPGSEGNILIVRLKIPTRTAASTQQLLSNRIAGLHHVGKIHFRFRPQPPETVAIEKHLPSYIGKILAACMPETLIKRE